MNIIDLTFPNIILFIIRLIFLPVKLVHFIIYGHPAPVVAGYCWYTEEEYEKMVKAGEDDKEKIDFRTYEEWQEFAAVRLKEMEAKKWVVIKVHVKTSELQNWLKENDLKNTAENREKYSTYRIQCFLEKGMS